MMKLMRRSLVFCAAACLALAGDTLHSQQSQTFALDGAQSKVEFKLGTTLHTVHGTFQLASGNLRFDAPSGKASGEIVVDAASGDSGSKSRDKRMNSSILESQKYPQIVFRPDRVEGKLAPDGKSEVQLHGMFTLHGADHEMTVPATVEAANGLYTVTATFTVPYIKWGLKNPSTLMLRVSDTVEITVHTVAKVN
jgi:polyisoprenoid-binding protein YceI